MSTYIYIGYDIRVNPKNSCISADANVWLQDEDTYEEAIIRGIRENYFQLLNPLNKTQLNELCHLVKNITENSVLILFAIEENVYNSLKKIFPLIENAFVEGISLSSIGFDVCDIDGFFSIFHMGKLNLTRKNLLGESELERADNIIKIANKTVTEHAPFYLVKLLKVESCETK